MEGVDRKVSGPLRNKLSCKTHDVRDTLEPLIIYLHLTLLFNHCKHTHNLWLPILLQRVLQLCVHVYRSLQLNSLSHTTHHYYLTEYLMISEPQNMLNDVSKLHKIWRSADFKPLKLHNDRSGNSVLHNREKHGCTQ